MLLTLMQILNVRVDLMMLGSISGASSVGIYVVVSRLTQQMYIVSAVINNSMLPSIAKLYNQGEIVTLQRIITKSARVSTAASLLVSIVLIAFSNPLLSLFGSDFKSGNFALSILVFGQIINISTGAVGSILTMSNNEIFLITSITLSTLLNVSINLVLIPKMDITGAAIATSVSLAVWNIMSYYFVKKKTGIESSFIGNKVTN